MSLIAAGVAANKKHNIDLATMRDFADGAASLPLRALVERFSTYNGFLFPEFAGVVIQQITEACRRNGLAEPATAVSSTGRVHADLLARLNLPHIAYFDEGPAEPETTTHLLAPCPNIHRSEELPRPISRRLALAGCPGFDFHTASNATLYVGPCDFQLFDAECGFYIPGATARPHTRTILSNPTLIVNRPVVLIQDIFNGYNFAHFLLDWLTRLAIFAMHGPVPAAGCLFIMGGIPTEFHRIVLEAACSELGLDQENFFFPTADVLIKSTEFMGYFSGQCDDSGHPAQMCRPEAMTWIDRLAHAVPSVEDTRRRKLYISRGDVGRRTILNEAELFAHLEVRNFLFVRLGDLAITDQLAVMRSADIIVAPHGMGLTYLALHTGHLKLVELHNPVEGTDTYAFVAKGKGFEYGSVIGESPGGTTNYRIGVSDVERALAGIPVTAAQSPPTMVIMDPRSQNWNTGCQSQPASVSAEISPPSFGLTVIRHVRNAAARVPDSNVGWWRLEMLQPLHSYTLSCMVYLPGAFCGDRVFLSIGEPRERTVDADLSQRDVWQLLEMTLTLAPQAAPLNLVLRVHSPVETAIFSTAWRVDPAPRASAQGIGRGDPPVAS